ncbi:hypothetical protein CVT25_014336, partial [Psilocybe cyanescens]
GSESESSIHRLPFEVIAHIFEFYVEVTKAWFYKPVKGPLLLGAICQLWRDIAWTTPSLWVTLTFKLEDDTTERQVQLAIGWLHRSGELPLSVYFHSYRRMPEMEPIIFPLIDVIIQLFARCRCLELNGLSSLALSRFSRYQGLSGLQSLHLKRIQLTTPFDLGSQAAPTELNIQDIHLNFLVIDWSNLTDLSAYGLHFDEVLQVLSLAPRMVRCYQDSVASSTSSTGYQSIIHLHLKDLFMELHDNSEITSFFQYTTFPNLSHYQVKTRSEFPTMTFLGFLDRSSCSIQTLGITTSFISAESLIQIAEVLHSVTNLILDTSWSPLHPFYNALCEDSRYANHSILPANVVLLPLLQRLSITTHRPFPWAWLSGIRHQYLYNGHTRTALPGRLDLRSVTVSSELAYDSSSRKGLIDNWETFSELMDLKKYLDLSLKLRRKGDISCGLFGLSYIKLQETGAGRQFDIKLP